MEKIKWDLIISINVFQKPFFLKIQLENIKSHILSNYCVILNCNEFMLNELKNISFPNNIFINPIFINKERFHGSLTNGIISNMIFALENFVFDQFIVLSGRTMFYKKMSLDNLTLLNKKWSNLEERTMNQKNNILNYNELILDNLGLLNEENLKRIENNNKNKNKNKNSFESIEGWGAESWYWPIFNQTKLLKYYQNLGFNLECSYHEGLVFSYQVTKNIIIFLKNQQEIFQDLINFPCCVEEFALQTISFNEVNEENLEYGFSFIGQGNCDPSKYDFSKENCFVLKVDPENFYE